MFKAIAKWWNALWGIKSNDINRAADEMYSNTESGIRAAFAKGKDELIKYVDQLISGMSQLEALLIEYKHKLEKLDSDEVTNDNRIEAAYSLLEDDPDNKEVNNDLDNFEKRAFEIDAEQDTLNANIDSTSKRLEGYDLQIKKAKDEIHALAKEEGETIADLGLANIESELLKKEAGFTSSRDMSAIDAVRKKRRDRKGELNVLRRVSGSDTQKRMDKYDADGGKSKIRADRAAILAARKSKNQAKNAGGATSKKVARKEKEREV